MKRSRFTEEKIVGMLNGQGAGMSTDDLCRKHGVGSAPLYKFRAHYSRLEVSDARRVKSLEDEIGREKADMLRDVIRENFRAILLEGERR